MATDNFPRSYIYLSQRILRERYQQHVAHEWDHKVASQFRPPLFTFGLDDRAGPDNPIWLARRVTEAVTDLTGSLEYPGKYVHAELPMTWSHLPVWQGGYRVAWLSGIARGPEGPTFVALCGSLRNYVGISYPDVDGFRGWWPSSAPGLSHILKGFSAEEEAPVDGRRPPDMEALQPLNAAHTISLTLGAGHQISSATLEVLFEVFEYEDNVELGGSEYRTALLGTPLWAATASPREFGTDIVYAKAAGESREEHDIFPSYVDDDFDSPSGDLDHRSDADERAYPADPTAATESADRRFWARIHNAMRGRGEN